MEDRYTGLIPDERSGEEKRKDLSTSALDSSKFPAGASHGTDNIWISVNSIQEVRDLVRAFYDYRNQSHTSTCVPQSVAGIFQYLIYKITGIKYPALSAAPIYRARKTEGGGMWMQNAFGNVIMLRGLPLESRVQSCLKGTSKTIDDDWVDQQADKMSAFDKKDGRNLVDEFAYFRMDSAELNNMDKYAEYAKMGAIMIGQKIPRDGKYWGYIMPRGHSSTDNYYHATFIPFAVILDGKEYLVSVDSSNTGRDWVRLLDEEWVRNNVYAGYVVTRIVEEIEEDEPIVIEDLPATKCYYGQTNNENVVKLQKYLQRGGYLPKYVKSLGNYFALTKKAVLKWQLEHINGYSHKQLKEWGGRNWGQISINTMLDLHR